jgi:hypothetical protein
MKQKQVVEKNKCSFCKRSTYYYFHELNCYICPKCLGEYKNVSGNVVIYPYQYSYTLPEPFLSRQVQWTSNISTTSEPLPKTKK